MSIGIPSRPSIPEMGKNGVNKDNYEAKILEYKEASATRNMAIQTMMEEQTQTQAMRTNLAKASHEALMAVVQNFK